MYTVFMMSAFDLDKSQVPNAQNKTHTQLTNSREWQSSGKIHLCYKYQKSTLTRFKRKIWFDFFV